MFKRNCNPLISSNILLCGASGGGRGLVSCCSSNLTKLTLNSCISQLSFYATKIKTGNCLFTHADYVIGLQDERSLHIDEGQSVLGTSTCILKAG